MIRYLIACWGTGPDCALVSLPTFDNLLGALTYFVEIMKRGTEANRPLSTIQLYRPEAEVLHCVLSHDFPGSRVEE